ncbi:rRNA methyltransferase [Weissella sagaensis]|jgi:tRNA A58 N-methylase Trm61|uniref:rRNA methyltransferase n=1 Tax=Weissella sagaensis TaxID=2559928 RepID=UPI0020C002B8|nr:rRNA methyltransferase [Weissella sagaensis]
MRKIQNLVQISLNEYLNPGDLAIDATIHHGDITRFLASRIGDTGKLLAFSEKKDEIDDVAASLFLSGLNDRVDLINKDFSNIINYLEPTQPIGAAMFQVDSKMDLTAVQNAAKAILMFLKTDGLLCLLSDDAQLLNTSKAYFAKLPANSYSVSYYEDLLTTESALVIQRH